MVENPQYQTLGTWLKRFLVLTLGMNFCTIYKNIIRIIWVHLANAAITVSWRKWKISPQLFSGKVVSWTKLSFPCSFHNYREIYFPCHTESGCKILLFQPHHPSFDDPWPSYSSLLIPVKQWMVPTHILLFFFNLSSVFQSHALYGPWMPHMHMNKCRKVKQSSKLAWAFAPQADHATFKLFRWVHSQWKMFCHKYK